MREVPALARGLRILELLAEQRKPMRISEIAARLELPRSATYELVSTLRAHKVVDQTADGEVVLGAKLYMFGASFAAGVDVARLAHEASRELRDRVDETIQVAILDDRYVLYIAKADSSRQLRLVSNVGRRLPAHVTGLGKALLASLPDEELDELFDGVDLETFTPTSIRSLAQLRREVKLIREQGYAVDNSESTPDVRCVAAPIRDRSGAAVAAISISVPVNRMTDALLAEHAHNVVEAAGDMSRRLGWLGAESDWRADAISVSSFA
jgi:IclR family KDG regulon transcriptional repressor